MQFLRGSTRSNTARRPVAARRPIWRDTGGMSRTRTVSLLAVLAIGAAAVAPGVASAKRYDIPAVMGDQLTALVEETPVGVMLPETLPFDYDGRLYASTEVTEGAWFVSLAGAKNCGGANACTLGTLSGVQGGERNNRIRVRLADGKNGWYRGIACGASCSPPSIEFVRGKVLYGIQAKVFQRGRSAKQILVAAANSALRAGLR